MDQELSLAALANKVHYSRGYLSKLETGKRTPSFQLASLIDSKLKANGNLLRLLERSRNSPEDCFCDLPLSEDEAGAVDAIDLPPDLAAATAINTEAVAKLFELHLAQVRGLGQHLSPSAVFPLLEGSLRSLRALLGSSLVSDRARLLVTASRYAEYTGWMAQEAGDESKAMAWTARAVRLANASGDSDMAAYAQVRRALVKLYHEDGEGTVALARRVRNEGGVSARVRGLAVMREGQGQALLGNLDEFRECMALAESILGEVDEEPRTTGYGTTTVVDPVRMSTGWSLYHLGRPSEGAGILADEIKRLPSDAPRSYGRYAVRCALQYVVAGELERACEVTAELLPRIADVVSATILVDLKELNSQIDRHRRRSEAREILPALGAAVQRQSTMIRGNPYA